MYKEINICMIIYLAVINIAAFTLMGIDKHGAIEHKWRIPEKTLFLTAILLGSMGAILGMNVFRHKTKHMSFMIGMPLIFIIQAVLAVYIIF